MVLIQELLRSQAENTILRAAVKFLMREGGVSL